MCVNATWVNDLIRWRQSKVKEAWNGDGGDGVSQSHCAADVMDALKWETRQVQVLLGPNDVDLFTVVESFADEWNVHQTEHCNVAACHLFGATESVLGLPVEGTLAEDGAEKAAIWQVSVDIVQDLEFGVSR